MGLSDGAFDALVVGAGAAGLAAAAELAAKGASVCVLEARERVGGRILTRRDPGLSVPLELGAEFIHGRPRTTLAWLHRANVAAIDVPQGKRWRVQSGRLRAGEDTFVELKRGLGRIEPPRADLSFSEFLDGPGRNTLAPKLRTFALSLIEGFDAADPAQASTLDTLESWTGEHGADAPTARPAGGYGVLIDALIARLDPQRVELRLGAVVDEVTWKRGGVRIAGRRHGRRFEVGAPRAIMTLPLGVLELPPGTPGAVRFDPPLTAKGNATAGLASGAVLKVLLRFRTAFWEELDDGRYRDGVFFHAPKALFRTFWTTLPTRSPLLTAWTGGPRAWRLSGLDESEIVARALESLALVFGERGVADAALESVSMHDWQSDPYSRGAYSYVTVGGRGAHAALAAPLGGGRLFFAGEATDTQGASATVAGALESGERAAREVLETGRRSRPRRAAR